MNDDISTQVLAVADAVRGLRNAITPAAAAPGHDAAGGTVDSLTEAVMGMTAGLVQIAEAISSLADAVHGLKRDE